MLNSHISLETKPLWVDIFPFIHRSYERIISYFWLIMALSTLGYCVREIIVPLNRFMPRPDHDHLRPDLLSTPLNKSSHFDRSTFNRIRETAVVTQNNRRAKRNKDVAAYESECFLLGGDRAKLPLPLVSVVITQH